MKSLCIDVSCSRKPVCGRFNGETIGNAELIGNFKEWRGCECDFFIPKNDEISPQEMRERAREVVNDERKDMM